MIDNCLIGYPESFISFITKSKVCFDIDYKTFELLLPSKELIIKDEEQYLECKEECRTKTHTFLDFPVRGKRVMFPHPMSYLFTYELLESGIKALDQYDEEPYYRITSFYYKDGKERKRIEKYRTTFTKKEFIESTKFYGKSKVKVRKK